MYVGNMQKSVQIIQTFMFKHKHLIDPNQVRCAFTIMLSIFFRFYIVLYFSVLILQDGVISPRLVTP